MRLATIVLVLAVAAAGCSASIPQLNARPTKYYEQSVTFRGRVSRMQELEGEVLLEVADAQEHRILVRVPAPVDVARDDWVKVKGILVPEGKVGGKVVYDLVQAESVTRTRAPWFRNLF